MKKCSLYILATILLYGLFREFTLAKALLVLAGLVSVYLIYRIPGRYILAMKYPFIFLSLCATAGFFLYPQIHAKFPVEPVIIFLSFYGIAFYLISLGEKDKGIYKEAIALSILYLSVSFNLFLMGKPLFILAIALAIMLFLYIIGRNKLMAIIGGYTLCIIVYLMIKKTAIASLELKVGDIDRYLLLAVTFILLIFSFIGFLKKPNMMKIMVFFGFLYIAIDILLVLGFRLSAGLLYQPIIALIIVAPLVGIMLKAEGERL
ncbi:MAG: hypothetical protein C0392_00850 [Syntrophus sp. (in: bacteria)]|nr:hypothetical protein [Syntrophus sp. (in: bacteria)]